MNSTHTADDSHGVEDQHRLIGEVFARYVRAADQRDPQAMAAQFTHDAVLSIYYRADDGDQPMASLTGAAAIGAAVTTGMAPHPPRGWSHHTMLNPLITRTGDSARFDAQFLVFNVLGAQRPAQGWPSGTVGAQGIITPIESGYVDAALHRATGSWLIATMAIRHDLPYVFP